MPLFPLQYQVDSLANVFSDRHLGLLVQELELLVLFRGDVHGSGNLVPCHGKTMHDHMSIVNAGLPCFHNATEKSGVWDKMTCASLHARSDWHLPQSPTWPSLSFMRSLPAPHHRACPSLVRFLFVQLSIAVFIPACGATQKQLGNPTMDLKVASSDFGAKFDRSRCDDKGKQVVSLDANGDGKPDVIKLFLSVAQDGRTVQQLVCKQTDLDFDGKIDLVQYYGPGGELFMDEYSMDYSGKFNGRTFYQEGKKVRAEKDMNFDGKPDYFEFYEGGKLVRVERDRSGNGKIDEWQYYEGGHLDRVGYDTTGSGRVDKWERNPEGASEAPVAQEGGAGTGAGPAAPPANADTAAAAAAADAASRGVPKAAPSPKKK